MSEQQRTPVHKRGETHIPHYKNSSLSVSERVTDLLQRMTLPEKIGQMTQLDITLINTTGRQKDILLDSGKARDLICNNHIGSFLNGEAVPPRTWFTFMRELTRMAVEETRLGIPLIFGIDHIHGAGYLEGATIFPQNLNIAATFNPEHALQTGRITALESADLGHHWIFAPILDLGINPLWPRLWETYGEDPHLAGGMGKAYVNGLQYNDETATYRQAATGKHFLGYSDPRVGWDRTPAHLSMQQIQEFHRPSFQKAVDAGLRTIMTNSGEINGVPVVASHDILTRLLRHEMGFEGVVITDWDDIGKLVNFHFTAENYKEAVYQSVMAGVDMSMTPLHLKFNSCLLELVQENHISEQRIDESVRRILKLKFDLGLFEHPFPRDDRFERIGCRENRRKALEAARESLVLLKNEKSVLPLKKPARIGLFGPSVSSRRNLSGGWTITWQGGSESRYPDTVPTIRTALEKTYPDAEVLWFGSDDIPVYRPASLNDNRVDHHTKTISKVNSFIDTLNQLDVIIYAGGEEPYCEFAGNISDLRLPGEQVDEIKLLSRSETPIVLILVQGRPRLITDIMNQTKAILFAGLPGFEGATAIADVISGRINPEGRLPVSYPMNPNHYLPYHHKRSNLYFFDPEIPNNIVPGNVTTSLFPFGYGLGYTSFEYSGLRLSASSMGTNGSITARVTVTNTGEVDGTETVLWFTSTRTGRITRPVKELKHYEKIRLKPGESATMTFVITPDQLCYPDETGRPILEKGVYRIMTGDLTGEFRVIG